MGWSTPSGLSPAGTSPRVVGRYTHRVAISNNRLVSMDNGKVRLRWKDLRLARDRAAWRTAFGITASSPDSSKGGRIDASDLTDCTVAVRVRRHAERRPRPTGRPTRFGVRAGDSTDAMRIVELSTTRKLSKGLY